MTVSLKARLRTTAIQIKINDTFFPSMFFLNDLSITRDVAVA